MANFDDAIPFTLQAEGGYNNDPADPGGETYCGITKTADPEWQGWAIVDEHKPLHSEQIINDAALHASVVAFYKSKYWDAISGDSINDQNAAAFFFDWSVTSGKAIKKVQSLVGVDADGAVGPQTIAAINNYNGNLLDDMKNARINYYKSLVVNNPALNKFLNGWLNRINNFFTANGLPS